MMGLRLLPKRVAPSQERELKFSLSFHGSLAQDVAPSQERELKFEDSEDLRQLIPSRSFTGA